MLYLDQLSAQLGTWQCKAKHAFQEERPLQTADVAVQEALPLKGTWSGLLFPALCQCQVQSPVCGSAGADCGSHLVAYEERGVGDSRNGVVGAVQAAK